MWWLAASLAFPPRLHDKRWVQEQEVLPVQKKKSLIHLYLLVHFCKSDIFVLLLTSWSDYRWHSAASCCNDDIRWDQTVGAGEPEAWRFSSTQMMTTRAVCWGVGRSAPSVGCGPRWLWAEGHAHTHTHESNGVCLPSVKNRNYTVRFDFYIFRRVDISGHTFSE